MNKNADQPAFPEITGKPNGSGKTTDIFSTGGLTKREYAAIMAMQGILAAHATSDNGYYQPNSDEVAKDAMECADRLLVQLDKSNNAQ